MDIQPYVFERVFIIFINKISVQMGSFQHISRYKSGCLYIQIWHDPFHSGGHQGPSSPIDHKNCPIRDREVQYLLKYC